MTRKLIALIMCLMMVCCSCAYAEDTAPNLIGEWKLEAIAMGEKQISPSIMSLTMILTINADGTFVMDSNGVQETGVWAQNGIELIAGADTFTYAEGTLITTEATMGAALVFLPVIPDLTGVWTLETIILGDKQVNPAMMGLSMTLTINADGTLIASSNGVDDAPRTWTQQGNELYVASDVYTYADGMLTIMEPTMGAMLYFTRNATEEIAVLPTAVPAADIAEFNGDWNLITVSMMGAEMPAAMMGMGLFFSVADGQVIAAFTQTLEDGTQNTTVGEAVGTLADGALQVAMPEGMEEMNVALQLRSDGMAFADLTIEGMPVTLIFEKVIAE